MYFSELHVWLFERIYHFWLYNSNASLYYTIKKQMSLFVFEQASVLNWSVWLEHIEISETL